MSRRIQQSIRVLEGGKRQDIPLIGANLVRQISQLNSRGVYIREQCPEYYLAIH